MYSLSSTSVLDLAAFVHCSGRSTTVFWRLLNLASTFLKAWTSHGQGAAIKSPQRTLTGNYGLVCIVMGGGGGGGRHRISGCPCASGDVHAA